MEFEEDGYRMEVENGVSSCVSDGVSSFPAFDSVPMSDVSSPPQESDEEEEEEPESGPCLLQTSKQLEDLAGMLACTNCDELPVGKVWMLGCCLHKYCQECATELAGKECVSCGEKGIPKDCKPDLFSTTILAQIPVLYYKLKEAEKRNFEGEASTTVVEESRVDSGIQDETCTPRPPSQSQDFPDVFEETPQNKLSRNSFTKDSDLAPRVLLFPTQESPKKDGDKEEALPVVSVLTPEKVEICDEEEELFKSPPPAPEPEPKQLKVSPPVEPPVLTPYVTRRSTRQGVGRMSRKGNSNTAVICSAEDDGQMKGRLSDEHDPPALTPYRPEEAPKNGNFTEVPVKLRLRKNSTKNTPIRKGSKSSMTDVMEHGLTTPLQSAVGPIKTEVASTTDSTGKSAGRRRRVSTASSVSSEKSCPSSISKPKQKKNAKGETDLHLKCKIGAVDKVAALIESGADVNAKDNADWTPLHEAINGKASPAQKLQMVTLLCENGADVNALGYCYATPLHCAVAIENEDIVKVLLEFRASPNIRNAGEKLPKDTTTNPAIIKLLEEKMVNVSIPVSPSGDESNLNNSTFLATTSVVEEDPAVMAVMVKTAVLFFNYPASPQVIAATKEVLGLKVSDNLTPKVTHIIHDYVNDAQRSASRVVCSQQYLYGLALCTWQVSSDWISASLKAGKVVTPTSFEIGGIIDETFEDEEALAIPGVARMNKEHGNGGLLTGLTFYLYKACSYNANGVKLTKQQLSELITASGGKTVNREPSPNEEPDLENFAFHVYHDIRGQHDASSGEPFAIELAVTKQIILYNSKSAKDSPPAEKQYKFEHIKTLKIEWLVDSLKEFKLKEPINYY